MPGSRDHGMIPGQRRSGQRRRDAHAHRRRRSALAPCTAPIAHEVAPVEAHDAGVEAMRIEIVIQNEIDDPPAAVLVAANQEGAALAARAPAALTQRTAQPPPEPPRAGKFMPRREVAGIVAAMEKFMDELQILNDAGGRTPDFRGHFAAPVLVTDEAFAVAGQVQRGPVLPVGRNTPTPGRTDHVAKGRTPRYDRWPYPRGRPSAALGGKPVCSRGAG